MCLKLPFKEIDHKMNLGVQSRDLVRTHPASLLDRQFLENLLFGQEIFQRRFFNFGFLGVVTKHSLTTIF